MANAEDKVMEKHEFAPDSSGVYKDACMTNVGAGMDYYTCMKSRDAEIHQIAERQCLIHCGHDPAHFENGTCWKRVGNGHCRHHCEFAGRPSQTKPTETSPVLDSERASTSVAEPAKEDRLQSQGII